MGSLRNKLVLVRCCPRRPTRKQRATGASRRVEAWSRPSRAMAKSIKCIVFGADQPSAFRLP